MSNDPVIAALRNPQTIRTQAHRILNLAKENRLQHFSLNLEHLLPTALRVIDVIHDQYPSLNIPYHSRWRHFEAGGAERLLRFQKLLAPLPEVERGAILYELVIISVLLDAGAGPSWHYKDIKTNSQYSRSEGLALASLALYQNGVFSKDPNNPLRVDASRLLAFTIQDFRKGFQITASNPLEGDQGRVTLLNTLGRCMEQNPRYFGKQSRLGNFYSYIVSLKTQDQLSATALFQAVLDAFNTIWPVKLRFNDISLGDVGIHSALKTKQAGSEYIPFHKLSQWLSYSLIEPLEQSGIKIVDLEELTGLPEYRNGGLFLDTQLLQVKNNLLLIQPQDPHSEAIVEWRALTVALLDELAVLIRKQLHQDALSLPLAKILQGGTWEAGRRIAKEKRNQGTPPIQIISNGSLF